MTAPAAGDERTTVAVGYDGSEAAQAAVRWAADYAASGGYRLRVVHAWIWPLVTKKLGPVKGVEGSGLRHAVLRDAARDARLLVVSSRGLGGVLGHVAGSVCLNLAGSSPCPLMVIRRPRSPGQAAGRHGPLRRRELLDHTLEEARILAPELSISGVLREGHAASKELLAAASDAEVLVIGTHNREGGPGNTVTAVLNKARCNVLITR